MIHGPKELSLTALEVQSEISSTTVLSTSCNVVVTEVVSSIDPSMSHSDTKLQVCPQTSAPSKLPPALSEALSAALEVSSVSAAGDIADVPTNTFSLNNAKALSGSESSYFPADMDKFRTPIPTPFTVLRASSVKEASPARVTSDSLQFDRPLDDLPKLGRKSVIDVPFDKLSNEILPSSSLSTEASSAMASSPLVPLISVMELMDEATPLLQSARRIPWSQVSILMFLQMVGPLTTHVVSPFTTELIRSAIGPNIGTNEQLEYLAEFLRSIFYFAEASTVLFWSRASDKVGRRPVILVGLIGSSLSMMCFGVSQSFWGSLVSCSLMSGLNGNDGVIRGMMAEMVDAADLARIYAFIPLANSAGASIGPLINNLLSRHTDQVYIQTFDILYLFTSSVPVILSITSFFLAFFFLKETVMSPAPLSSLFELPEVTDPEDHHESALTHVVSALHVRPPELQDGLALGGAAVSVVAKKLPFNPTQLLSIRCLFMNPPVIIALGNFAFLSLIEITFRNIQLLFLANSISSGGLSLSAGRTDNIISACGIINGVVQLMFFTRIHDYLGPKKSFLCGVASAVPLFLMFPVMRFFTKDVCNGIILWIALGIQIILFLVFNLAFGAIFMFITASSPTPESIGAINGLSQMLANSLRGIAPGVTSNLFVLSVEKGYIGGNLVYIVLAAIAGLAMVAAWHLPHEL